MKQYTNSEQTAKLIALGLPRPRCLHDGILAYNIGELLEMLPETLCATYDDELINGLYDMVIVLKRQGIMPND